MVIKRRREEIKESKEGNKEEENEGEGNEAQKTIEQQ